jgi:hypothetical protein
MINFKVGVNSPPIPYSAYALSGLIINSLMLGGFGFRNSCKANNIASAIPVNSAVLLERTLSTFWRKWALFLTPTFP